MTILPDFDIPESPAFNPDDYSEPIKNPIGVASFGVAALATTATSVMAQKGLALAGDLVPGYAKFGIKAMLSTSTALSTIGVTSATTGSLPPSTAIAIAGISTLVGMVNPIAGIITSVVLSELAKVPPPTATSKLQDYLDLKDELKGNLKNLGFGTKENLEEYEKHNNPLEPTKPTYGTGLGQITPGKMKTIDTPAGKKQVHDMKEIDTPAGKKSVSDGSHYNSPPSPGSQGHHPDSGGGSPGSSGHHPDGGGSKSSGSPSAGSGSKSSGSGGYNGPAGGNGTGPGPAGGFNSGPSKSKQNHYDHVNAGQKLGLPILLDLDGNGVTINELSRSTIFKDAGGDGLQHRTAWAGAGDGVLFFDADADGALSQKREYVFTEWDPTAATDMEALRTYFDTNGDGKLTSADAAFAQFKVLVTNADGSTTVKALAQLGITEINLTEDSTRIELADGSVIEG